MSELTPTEVKVREDFLKKHKPLNEDKDIEIVNRKSISDVITEQEQIKKQYNADMASVESALTDFLNIKDPIVFNGKAIAWVRRPTMKELKNLFPREMMEAVKDQKQFESISQEQAESWDKEMYKVMSNLIEIPKHTAEEWETKSNSVFVSLFYEHLANIVKKISPDIEGF